MIKEIRETGKNLGYDFTNRTDTITHHFKNLTSVASLNTTKENLELYGIYSSVSISEEFDAIKRVIDSGEEYFTGFDDFLEELITLFKDRIKDL